MRGHDGADGFLEEPLARGSGIAAWQQLWLDKFSLRKLANLMAKHKRVGS